MTNHKFNYQRIQAMEERIKELEVKASILEVNNKHLKDRIAELNKKLINQSKNN